MADNFHLLDEKPSSNNSDAFSLLDSYAPAAPKPSTGLGARIVNTGQALGRMAYDMPGNIAGYAGSLAEGSRPLDENNWADTAVKGANQRLNERMTAPDANDPTLLGTKGDWAQTGSSIPFSLGSMDAAIGAGALTGAVTKNPQAAFGAGAVAAGALAHRADSAMFMRNALDGYTKKYQQDNNGAMPSQEALLAEQERLQPYANEHGLWEAVPEGVGSAIGGKLVGGVFKQGGNLLAKGAKAIAGIGAEELPTETITQHGQNNTEIDAGVHGGEKRSWTNLNDLGQSLGEVAMPVLQQSLLMGGGAAAIKKAYDYASSGPLSRAATQSPTWQQPDYTVKPDANALIQNRTIPGKPLQESIDNQYQDGGYNPLDGAWEKPTVNDIRKPNEAPSTNNVPNVQAGQESASGQPDGGDITQGGVDGQRQRPVSEGINGDELSTNSVQQTKPNGFVEGSREDNAINNPQPTTASQELSPERQGFNRRLEEVRKARAAGIDERTIKDRIIHGGANYEDVANHLAQQTEQAKQAQQENDVTTTQPPTGLEPRADTAGMAASTTPVAADNRSAAEHDHAATVPTGSNAEFSPTHKLNDGYDTPVVKTEDGYKDAEGFHYGHDEEATPIKGAINEKNRSGAVTENNTAINPQEKNTENQLPEKLVLEQPLTQAQHDQASPSEAKAPEEKGVTQGAVKNAQGVDTFSESAAKAILSSKAKRYADITPKTHELREVGKGKFQVVPKAEVTSTGKENLQVQPYVYHVTNSKNISDIKSGGLTLKRSITTGGSDQYLHVSTTEEDAGKWAKGLKKDAQLRFKPTEQTKDGTYPTTKKHHGDVKPWDLEIKEDGEWKPLVEDKIAQPRNWHSLGSLVNQYLPHNADFIRPSAQHIKEVAVRLGISQKDAVRAKSVYDSGDNSIVKGKSVPTVTGTLSGRKPNEQTPKASPSLVDKQPDKSRNEAETGSGSTRSNLPNTKAEEEVKTGINFKDYKPSKDVSGLFDNNSADDIVSAIKKEKDWQYARQGNAYGVNYWINHFTMGGERYTAFTPKQNDGNKTIIVHGEHGIINNQLPMATINKSARIDSILGKLKNTDLNLPYLKIDVLSKFLGDIARSNGEAFSTIGAAKTFAKKLRNANDYTLVLFNDGFALRKIEHVENSYNKIPVLADNQAAIEHIESKGIEKSTTPTPPIKRSTPSAVTKQGQSTDSNAEVSTQPTETNPQDEQADKGVKLADKGESGVRFSKSQSTSANNTVRLAQEKGYKGNSNSESKEWLRAAAKGLDMSQEARMARAKAMGFDVDTIWYHGTNAEFSEFETHDKSLDMSIPNPRGDNIGVFFAQNKNHSKEFGKNIGEYLLAISNPKIFHSQESLRIFVRENSGQADDIRDEEGYIIEEGKFENNTRREIEASGHDSVLIERPTFSRTPSSDKPWAIAFYPNQIRSIHAAFDPDFKESGNLLASKSTLITGSTVADIKKLLPARVNKLVAAGKLVVVQSADDLPEHLNALYHRAFHGSPHDHNRFDSSKIGTGEGAQAFGYGHYFTDEKDIAEYYKNVLSHTPSVQQAFEGEGIHDDNLYSFISEELYANGGDTKALADKIKSFHETGDDKAFTDDLNTAERVLRNHPDRFAKTKGKLYEVELAPTQDEYLDWDKPLSEQSDKVKDGLKSAGYWPSNPSDVKGSDVAIPKGFSGSSFEAEDRAHQLHKAGIRGVRYKAEGGKSDASNYVIFDDNDISITAKYSKLDGVEAMYDGKLDKLYLVADMLNKDNLSSVLAHELLHRGEAQDPKLKTAIDRFESDLSRRFDLASRNIGTKAELNAYKRVMDANTPEQHQSSEFRAYLISEYMRSPDSFTGKVKQVFADFIASIRAFLIRSGADIGFIKSLTPADLAALSKYGAQVYQQGTVDNKVLGQLASVYKWEGTAHEYDQQFYEGVFSENGKKPGVRTENKYAADDKANQENKAKPAENSGVRYSRDGKSIGGLSKKYTSKADIAEEFKKQTGDNIFSASGVLAGVALRNNFRDNGNLNDAYEESPYTDEQMELIDLYNAFGKKSPYLFHTTRIDNLKSIQENGLLTDAKRRYEGVSGDGRISFAANEQLSKYYGSSKDAMLRVKKNYVFSDLESDFLGGEGTYTTKTNVPADALEIKVGRKWVALNKLNLSEYSSKSAIGNTGTFRPESNDIRYSKSMADLAGQATEFINNHIDTSKTFNLWHKTVGTQAHKATVDKHFKAVFDKSMAYEEDTAKLANEAADAAPSWFPKLDGMVDAVKEFPNGLKRIKDAKKVGEAIFQTTINDKRMTDAELSADGYTDHQRTMYHEFFAAVNKSMNDLAKSEMLREAKALKMTPADEKLSVKDTANFYAEQTQDPNEAKSFIDKAQQIEKLQKQGYAPLMRFGRYTVDVVKQNAKGEENRVFFGMFETESEANQMRKVMESEYPDSTVKQGIMSQNDWQMFKGVTPESMEVFAKMMNVDQDKAFQQYLAQAVNNRSAMKRLIHRKKMPGFANDPQRVLASFITSNAKMASKNIHLGDMVKAIADIPKEKGDVKDEAVELYNYVQNPSEKGAAIRGMLFAWYLGGSAASAMVNLSQTLTTTTPYLHQYGTTKQVAAIMGQAMKLAARNHNLITGDLGAALKRADEEGVTAPHELHMLYGDSMRTSTISSLYLRPLTKVWGSLFSLAESYNRRVAFIAAYKLAQQNGNADPFAFAAQAVKDTQFIYSKSSRPNWGRSTVGSMVMTFKTFSISYLEFLKRLPPKERTIALGILIMLAGLSGLPGADDADDVIDTLGQSLGYNTNSKEWKDKVLSSMIGKTAADYMLYGASTGLPVDIGGRLGVGNLIPGSSLLKKSETNKSRDVMEFAGAAGSLAAKAVDAWDAASSRDDLTSKVQAIGKAVIPKAFSDAWQAADMIKTGQYRDARGRKVVETDTTDAILKGLGLQPTSVSEPRRVQRFVNQDVTMTKAVKADIAELWAQGMYEKDRSKVEEAKAMMADWNEKNPETPIKVNMKQIIQRTKQMKLTSAQRMIKTTPKEMRGYAREMLD